MTDTSDRPGVKRVHAAMLLHVSLGQLNALKLRRWHDGRRILYDAEQVVALVNLREHWLRLDNNAPSL